MRKHNEELIEKDVDEWSALFREIELNVVPLNYVDAVLLRFKDGDCWEIPIPAKTRLATLVELEDNIAELIQAYEQYIYKVDIKIDTDKIKKDVEKAIKKMSKKLKL